MFRRKSRRDHFNLNPNLGYPNVGGNAPVAGGSNPYQKWHQPLPPLPPPPRAPDPPPSADPRLWQCFTSVDTDGSGFIDVRELQRALINMNWSTFDLDTMKMLMNIFDTDCSRNIGFNDFAELYKYIEGLQAVFHHWDADHSGTIEERELIGALNGFGYNISPQLVKLVVTKHSSVPPAAYGGPPPSITFERFVRVCIEVKTLTEAFRKADKDNDGWIQIPYEHFIGIYFKSLVPYSHAVVQRTFGDGREDVPGPKTLISKQAHTLPEETTAIYDRRLPWLDRAVGATGILRNASEMVGLALPDAVGPVLEKFTAVLGTLIQMMENKGAWQDLMKTLDAHQQIFNEQLVLLIAKDLYTAPKLSFLIPIKLYSHMLEEILAAIMKESRLADKNAPPSRFYGSEQGQIQVYTRRVSDAMRDLKLALVLYKMASNEHHTKYYLGSRPVQVVVYVKPTWLRTRVVRLWIDPQSSFDDIKRALAAVLMTDVVVLKPNFGPRPYWVPSNPGDLVGSISQWVYAVASASEAYLLGVLRTSLGIADYPIAIFIAPEDTSTAVEKVIFAAASVAEIHKIAYHSGNLDVRDEVLNSQTLAKLKNHCGTTFPTVWFIETDPPSRYLLSEVLAESNIPPFLQTPLVHCEYLLRRADNLGSFRRQLRHVLKCTRHIIITAAAETDLTPSAKPSDKSSDEEMGDETSSSEIDLTSSAKSSDKSNDEEMDDETSSDEMGIQEASGDEERMYWKQIKSVAPHLVEELNLLLGRLTKIIDSFKNNTMDHDTVESDIGQIFIRLCGEYPGAVTIRRSDQTFEGLKGLDNKEAESKTVPVTGTKKNYPKFEAGDNGGLLWQAREVDLQDDKIFGRQRLRQAFDYISTSNGESVDPDFLNRRLKNPMVYVWGESQHGCLGTPLPGGRVDAMGTTQYWPIQLDTPRCRIVELASGGWSFSALDSEGQLHVWGQLSSDPNDHLYQHGGFSHRNKQASHPLRLALPTRIKAISNGRDFATALDYSGRVWCFNSWGRPFILQIAAFDLSNPDKEIVQVECGWSFSAALSISGTVFVWNPLQGAVGEAFDHYNRKLDHLHDDDNMGMEAYGVIKCHTWTMEGIEPLSLPKLPSLDDDDATPPRLVKIAAGDRFVVGLTDRGHVVKLDLKNVNDPSKLLVKEWEYMTHFYEASKVKELNGIEGPAPLQLKISAISAHWNKFTAYSTGKGSIVLMGTSDHVSTTKPEVITALTNQGVVTIVLGDYHFGALLENGKLLTWGQANAAGLGDLTSMARGNPGGFVIKQPTAQRPTHFLHVLKPTEVRFDHALAKPRKRFVLAAAAGGQHMGALVVDIEEGGPEVKKAMEA